ncbi:MAG: NAD/NADP octopine/nopaline dehydrogenase family protein [Anaerolineae bacterium]
MTKVAILGAGNGGMTMAAHLGLEGHEVRLYELPVYAGGLAEVSAQGGIRISGVEKEGFGAVALATSDIAAALHGAEVVFNPVPAYAYGTLARVAAPHLEDGQIVVTMGKGGGSVAWSQVLKELGIEKDVVLGETNTLLHGCRKIGPAEVTVFGVIQENVVAAFPGKHTDRVREALQALFPTRDFRRAPNLFESVLLDFNAITHTGPMIANAARIDSGYRKEEFHLFGRDENPPAVCNIIEAIDRERMALAQALDIEAVPLEVEHTRNKYNPGHAGDTVLPMYESMHTEKLEQVPGPYSLKARHLTEDVPYGLVTWASLGQMLNVPTPASEAIITLASILNQEDYWALGRTVEKMGIDPAWSKERLKAYLEEGY